QLLELEFAPLPEVVDLELQVIGRPSAAVQHAVENVLQGLANLALRSGEIVTPFGHQGANVDPRAVGVGRYLGLITHPRQQLGGQASRLALELGPRHLVTLRLAAHLTAPFGAFLATPLATVFVTSLAAFLATPLATVFVTSLATVLASPLAMVLATPLAAVIEGRHHVLFGVLG